MYGDFLGHLGKTAVATFWATIAKFLATSNFNNWSHWLVRDIWSTTEATNLDNRSNRQKID